jgi:hypothetical protein
MTRLRQNLGEIASIAAGIAGAKKEPMKEPKANDAKAKPRRRYEDSFKSTTATPPS